MSAKAHEAAKLFHSNKLSALADGDLSFVRHIASKYLNFNSEDIDIKRVYDEAYLRLSKEYRSEYFFKNTIATRKLLGTHSLKTATMLSEFRVGKSKADCVILNGKSTCYEIKTEYDTLTRLEEQLNDYLTLFDEVFVVCSEKNLDSVLRHTDKRVGVLELTSRNYLSQKRRSTTRTAPIDIDIMMRSLRKEEYLELTKRTTGFVPDVPNGRLMNECHSLLKTVDTSCIATCLIDVLKKMRINDAMLINALPSYLTNAAISYQFSSKQVEALKQIFGTSKEQECTYLISEESNTN
ncbi:sce7726 family protein [Vibrio splendidus]